MAAGTALIALGPPAMDEPMRIALATRTSEPIGPASLLQSSLTMLFGPVEPLELKQREASLEMDGTAQHNPLGLREPTYALNPTCEDRAG
jgi:hypothetical protein